jgi:ABC-type glycerol-3-phosphate transport system permease component
MAVMRFLASLFLLVAVIAMVDDATQSLITSKPFQASSMQQHWMEIAPNTLNGVKAGLNRAAGPQLWEAVLSPLLATPTFVLFGLLAALSGYAGRRRRRVEVFTN